MAQRPPLKGYLRCRIDVLVLEPRYSTLLSMRESNLAFWLFGNRLGVGGPLSQSSRQFEY